MATITTTEAEIAKPTLATSKSGQTPSANQHIANMAAGRPIQTQGGADSEATSDATNAGNPVFANFTNTQPPRRDDDLPPRAADSLQGFMAESDEDQTNDGNSTPGATDSNFLGFVARATHGLANYAIRRVPSAAPAILRIENAIGQTFGFDVHRAADFALNNAASRSRGLCARYVRLALQAGGIDMSGHPSSAAGYIGFLDRKGFNRVDPAKGLQVGDVVVFPAVPGHPHGHIAYVTAGGLVSDFKQRGLYVADAYRGGGYVVYRHTGAMSPGTALASNSGHRPQPRGTHPSPQAHA